MEALANETTKLTSYLPKVRCNDDLKGKLLKVAEHSVTNDLADHIRFAVEQYVDRQLANANKLSRKHSE